MEGDEGTYTEENYGSRESSRSTWKLCWNNGRNRSTRDTSLAKFEKTRIYSMFRASTWNWGKAKDRDVARSESTEKAPKNKKFSGTSQSPSFQKIVDEFIKSEKTSEKTSQAGDIMGFLDDKYSWEEYVKFLEPLISGMPEKLSDKDITLSSKIYKEPINIRGLEERLMHLPTEGNSTLDVPLEMAYGASLLHKLTHQNEILKAGEKAHKAAVLFLQAEILREVGNKLLRDCRHELCQLVDKKSKRILIPNCSRF